VMCAVPTDKSHMYSKHTKGQPMGLCVPGPCEALSRSSQEAVSNTFTGPVSYPTLQCRVQEHTSLLATMYSNMMSGSNSLVHVYQYIPTKKKAGVNILF
jgi:hypothetical protein